MAMCFSEDEDADINDKEEAANFISDDTGILKFQFLNSIGPVRKEMYMNCKVKHS